MNLVKSIKRLDQEISLREERCSRWKVVKIEEESTAFEHIIAVCQCQLKLLINV